MPERFLTRASAEQAPVAEQLSREIETFSMLSQADPKNVSLLYTVGMLYQLAGRPQEVCDHLYKAYLLDPERCIIITEFLHEHILLRTALCADGSPASRAGCAAADVGAFMGAVRIQPG